MQTSTKYLGWLGACLIVFGLVAPAQAQRTVTLTLNMATVADTIRTDSFIEVRGQAGHGTQLLNDQVIDWGDASTLEPVNVGGDYWRIQFDIADTTSLTFKFYSQQMEDAGLNGWEADPNPSIDPGTGDVDMGVHYFESQSEWMGVSGDRGDYDWRPFPAKQDSVGVWYRVYMKNPEGALDGYDRSNSNHFAAVTGDPILGDGAPYSWGDAGAQVALTRESSNNGIAGFDTFSGVVYYPTSAAGTVQNYKFVLMDESGIKGWEEGELQGNRSFTVPAADTTLQWVYYGNSIPTTVQPVAQNVIFAVNLDAYEEMGIFRVAAGDTLEVRGSFNGWGCSDPTLCLMDRVPGTNEYEGFYGFNQLPLSEVAFKYFLNFNDDTFQTEYGFLPPPGWEEGHATGVNRTFAYSGSGFDQDLGLHFFNDITSSNVIAAGEEITINYQVDMSPAVGNAARPFDPAGGDSVWIAIEDPMWKLTQQISNPALSSVFDDPNNERPRIKGVMHDADGDMVYDGFIVVKGPTYSALTYKFVYGQNNDEFAEPGTGLGSNPGRNRTEFIDKVNGSWPDVYTTTAGVFSLEGALPFEVNPSFSGVDVEQIGTELPSSISLEQNYPNPFNPLTTFEYSLSASQRVQLNVYDILGRRIATLVDGVQAASTYRVNFDASNLTSGTYFYRLETEGQTISKKMILLK